jgi:hypothetical protein
LSHDGIGALIGPSDASTILDQIDSLKATFKHGGK